MKKFFQLIPSDTNIDFVGKFKPFLAFSLICIVAVIIGMATKGLNYGIDFTGGEVVQVQFTDPKPVDEVREALNKMGYTDATVVAIQNSQTEYIITTRAAVDAKEASMGRKLIAAVGADKVKIQSADLVGPKVGSELKASALKSLIYTILLITIYIWFRFDAKFAPGATIAMLHDLFMATGFYLITGHEFSITAVAALLTIAGYSVNDTIVIYDRVREMLKDSGDSVPLPKIINKALNLTLSRTLITAGVTFLSVIPIMLLTEGDIQSFAYAMCFGVIVGCYSTIYVAVPMTIYVEQFMHRRDKKKGNTPPSRKKPVTA